MTTARAQARDLQHGSGSPENGLFPGPVSDEREAGPDLVSLSGLFLGPIVLAGPVDLLDCLCFPQVVLNLGAVQNSHDGRISCLGLSADGSALCTGSWDRTLKVSALPHNPTPSLRKTPTP